VSRIDRKTVILKVSLFVVLVAAAVLLVVLLEGVGEAGGSTWYVDDDAPPGGDGSEDRPFQEIGEALEEAKDGDAIRVFAGMYNESLVVSRSLSIRGNSSVNTTINGTGSGDVVRIVADGVNISGFTVRNSGDWWDDSGIEVLNGDNCFITGNNCSDNFYGIYLAGSTGNRVLNNSCSDNYCGIRLWSSHDTTIKGNTCMNGQGGIFLHGSTRNRITNNQVLRNQLRGIYLWEGSDLNTVDLCSVSFNDHGVDIYDSDNNTITKSLITSNDIGVHVSLFSMNNSIRSTSFYSNTEYGIRVLNNAGFWIDAAHNLWKDDTGPHHGSRNPRGRGDNVTDHVRFSPWVNETGKRFFEEGEGDDPGSGPWLAVVGVVVLAVVAVWLGRDRILGRQR